MCLRQRRLSIREKADAHMNTHTLCNAYFTPVEQQHGLPIITSMNHGLPSGCQEDGGGGEDDGEQK